jgi:RNA polymerase sigma factor (sigma-70 family)
VADKPGNEPPIESLARGELRAEQNAAWKLFEAAWPTLERFVRVRLMVAGLPENLVADCGQEVFTRVWKFRTSYQGTTEAEFWRWLQQICDNERRRCLGRRAGRMVGSLADGDSEEGRHREATNPDRAAGTLALREELAALRDCLEELDSNRRQVIDLAYFDPALSERAIAAVLGCSPSNVHKLKMEGLRQLQACLARKGIK